MAFGLVAEKIIENVSTKVLDYLRENIEKYVYEYGDSNEIYHAGSAEATYEFYNSFKWKDIEASVKGISKELFYDYLSMNYDKDTWLHGSDSSKVKKQGGDARKFLASILNAEGKLSSLFLTKPRKPYWDITMKELFDNKKIDGWFDIEFAKAGFKRA